MIDWNDLKYLLHTVREGSALGASRILKTSQSTVMRRIALLEEQFGVDLFDKRRSGYLPTEALVALLPRLEDVERAHRAFDVEVAVIDRGLSGTVRLTASELLATHALISPLVAFRKEYPAINVEVTASDAFMSLADGEADIALRAGNPSREPQLFGRRILLDSWSLYCSKAYADEHGMPNDATQFANHSFVLLVEGTHTSPLSVWLEQNVPRDRVVFRHTSLVSIFYSVKAGHGISACPDILALSEPDLVRCMPLGVGSGNQLWLLAHERHRNTPRIRIVLDFISSHLATRQKAKGL